jgi:hypothetical protein
MNFDLFVLLFLCAHPVVGMATIILMCRYNRFRCLLGELIMGAVLGWLVAVVFLVIVAVENSSTFWNITVFDFRRK